METVAPPLALRVDQVDREQDLRAEVGQVEFHPDGRLVLLSALPSHRDYLAEVLAEVNAKPTLRIRVPPPEDAQPYSLYSLTFHRQAPNLLQLMREHMEQQYNLILCEEGG